MANCGLSLAGIEENKNKKTKSSIKKTKKKSGIPANVATDLTNWQTPEDLTGLN